MELLCSLFEGTAHSLLLTMLFVVSLYLSGLLAILSAALLREFSILLFSGFDRPFFKFNVLCCLLFPSCVLVGSLNVIVSITGHSVLMFCL